MDDSHKLDNRLKQLGLIFLMFFLLLGSVRSEENHPPEIISISGSGSSFFSNHSDIRASVPIITPFCGDGICDSHETPSSCIPDCKVDDSLFYCLLDKKEYCLRERIGQIGIMEFMKITIFWLIMLVVVYILYKKVKYSLLRRHTKRFWDKKIMRVQNGNKGSALL